MTDALIEKARDLVDGVRNDGCSLIGACIVSSLAAGDFTPVSDVDMLMVAADDERKPDIFRRLIEDRVFEWMILPSGYLRDVEAILAHAGLCHDILEAIILLDTGNWLGNIQQQVVARCEAPEWIRKRVMDQVHRVAVAIDQMERHLASGAILSAQRAHVSILRSLFAIPSAVLNKRCTMSRGAIFCRQSSSELGWGSYLTDVLTIFGAAGIAEETVYDLQIVASQIIAASHFTGMEKVIRQWFLRSSQWLLENGQPSDAVWPLYIWASATVEESGGQRNPLVWDLWQRFTAILGVSSQKDLLDKCQQARRLLEPTAALCEIHHTPT